MIGQSPVIQTHDHCEIREVRRRPVATPETPRQHQQLPKRLDVTVTETPLWRPGQQRPPIPSSPFNFQQNQRQYLNI